MNLIRITVHAYALIGCSSKEIIAERLGMTKPTLNTRLRGVTDWKGKEIDVIEMKYYNLAKSKNLNKDIKELKN